MLFKRSRVKGEKKQMSVVVNDREVVLHEGQILVSHTDLKGVITYVNSDFLDVSGFERSELIGYPHSVIRHPDMPRSAFYDLWTTIKKGKSWRGFVKNRTKDGGFYWVDARVSPLFENDEHVGYLSVRYRPNRSDIDKISRLYFNLINGKAHFPYTEDNSRIKIMTKFLLLNLMMILPIAFGALSSFLGVELTVAAAVSGGLFLLVYIYQAALVNKQLIKPVKNSNRIGDNLARGYMQIDLPVNRHDEVGELYKSMHIMMNNFAGVIGKIKENGEKLSHASDNINATAHALSQNSSEQAAAVEETSSSLEQMTATITQNAENAHLTEDIAKKTSELSVQGGEAVAQTVRAMSDIAGAVGVIEEITYQTNLLALNAAIEAARAGESGKGFAVVAAEVRKLAERSQAEAQRIRDMVSDSLEVSQRAGELIETVVPEINRTAELVKEISAASMEQKGGVDQMNNAVAQLNQVAQSNAASAEELSGTSEEMADQTKVLRDILNAFKMKRRQ